MTEIKIIKRCPRCGVIIQSIDRNLPGYVHELYYQKLEVVLCESCFFETKQIEEDAFKEPQVDEDYLKILRLMKSQNAIIIYVIDLFLMQTTFSKKINEIINGMDVIAVLNKRDLFPALSESTISSYALQRIKLGGLEIKETMITDKQHDYDIGDLSRLVEKYEGIERRNVYLIGTTSSGKSSIFNAYLKNYSNVTDKLITTAPFLDTPIRVMSVPLDEHFFLYDVPGYILENSLLSIVDKSNRKVILPTDKINITTFPMMPKTSIIIGGVARFDFISGKRTSVSLYLSKQVDIRRVPLASAEKQFADILKAGKAKPSSKAVASSDDMIAYEINVDEVRDREVDVGIVGLGFIRFKTNKQSVRLLVPKKVGIYSAYKEEEQNSDK